MLYPKSQTPAFPVHVSVEATCYLEEGTANRAESWACQRLVPRRQKRKRKQKVLTFDESLLAHCCKRNVPVSWQSPKL